MAHKMSLCMFRDDTKLSPPAFMDLFTHKLVLVMSPLFGVGGFLVVCFGFCLLFCFLVFFRVFLLSVTAIGLCIGPPPVYFCGRYRNGLCVT